ncbi:MAG: phospho-N-acetylmuramoyl-pentapeptide-transferase [bacterium]|nr:phospho-N-acetylmuramoyl-pentapeptide-transferase [bacterium]MDZ4231544.1 phospho-N-acetylmuramoyl-pentapeptide-transferase [Patescibacteria group bacterium]
MMIEVIRVVTVSIISFVVAFTLAPIILKGLRRAGAGKQIRVSEESPIFSSLHKKKEGTPTMGGLTIWLTLLITTGTLWLLAYLYDGFWEYLSFVDRAETFLPLAAFLIAALLGLFDDVLGVMRLGDKGGGLKVSHKLVVYFLISVVGAWWFTFKLDWQLIHVPFLGNFDIGWWYVPIFMFIIVASAFSGDITDGLDGLWGGVSLFIYAALGIVAFALGRYDLAAMIGVILGALLAFLWFNIYPAKFFMGDTGAMALGITMGVITMLTNTVFLLPLFAIVPVVESVSVIAQTISKKLFKRKIFLSTPIHHHFEALGWPESQITMRFWIISVMGVGAALAMFFLDRLLF